MKNYNIKRHSKFKFFFSFDQANNFILYKWWSLQEYNLFSLKVSIRKYNGESRFPFIFPGIKVHTFLGISKKIWHHYFRDPLTIIVCLVYKFRLRKIVFWLSISLFLGKRCIHTLEFQRSHVLLFHIEIFHLILKLNNS